MEEDGGCALMGIQVVKCGGEFFIDNLSMHRAAFCVTSDVEALTQHKAAHRGSGLVIPEVTGELARRMRPAAAEHQLNMVIVGDVLWDGTAPANPDEGFEENMDWLEANVWGVPSSTNSTREGKVITDGGSTRTNPIQVFDMQRESKIKGRDHNGTMTVGCLATLYVRIPRGKLEI